MLAKLDQSILFAKPKVDKTVELGMAASREETTGNMRKKSGPATAAAIGVIDEIVLFEKKLATAAEAEGDSDNGATHRLMLIICVLAMRTGAAVAWFISRSITGPIRAAAALAERVAAGDLSTTVVVASHEQGIEQINHAIGEMDAVTQQNAARVEEAAAAAGSLREQAGNLAQAVGVFKLDTQGAPQRVPKAAAVRAIAAAPVRKLGPAKARIATQNAAVTDQCEEF